MECRIPVLNNIIISGGMFKLKNMSNRLQMDIEEKYKQRIANTLNLNVKIIDCKE